MDQTGRPIIRTGYILVVVIVLTLALGGCGAAESTTNHAKTQVLLYLVGSDLETNDATGTFDLNEIATTFGDTDTKNLDVVVAFGGANKEGWKGMKVATIEQLRADAKTEKFGNGEYLYADTGADMGSGASLKKFFSVVRQSRTADKTILIISDHGNSYDGIGTDDITKNTLQMGDISGALQDAGISSPPMVFDACLMSSVEVGKAVQPYTSLMLGSEEIQRGSYSYERIIRPLTDTPDLDTKTLMTKIADDYIGDAKLQKAKTASIIDVTKIQEVRDGLDELGRELNPIIETDQGLHDLKAAYNGAIRLGVQNGGAPTSVDLISLLENIEKKRPEVSTSVQKVISAVNAAVVYEKHNSYSPAVAGLSIASPDAMDTEKYRKFGDAVKVAPEWDKFFERMIEVSQKSSSGSAEQAVSKTPESMDTPGDEDRATSASSRKVQNDRKNAALSRPQFVHLGNGTFDLKDPYHGASVYASYYRINGSQALSIGSRPVMQDADGLYRIPAWDGRWYFLQTKAGSGKSVWDQIMAFFSSATGEPQAILLDMEYEDPTSGGFAEYDSWIAVQDQHGTAEATLVTYVNTSSNQCEMLITPYIETSEGITVFGGDMDRFDAGSRVTSYTTGFDLTTGKFGEYTLGSGTVGPDTLVHYAMVPDGTYATGFLAYYDNDNEVHTDQFRIITIKNGAVVSSVIGPLS